MNKSVSAIIATALLAVQTNARELASTANVGEHCIQFFSEPNFKGKKTELCHVKGEGSLKYNDVNFQSYKSGSRVQFHRCDEFKGDYASYASDGWCEGWEASRAAGISQGNFFNVPEDSKNTRLLIQGYNPTSRGAVTFFNDPNCSFKPTILKTKKHGEAKTFDKEDMFARGIVKNNVTWSFMIPKGHKMERCDKDSQGKTQCQTYTASSWQSSDGQEIMECQEWVKTGQFDSLTVERARPANGRWTFITSHVGSDLTHEVTEGWEKSLSHSERQQEQYSIELAASAGFSYGFFSGSVELRAGFQQQMETSTAISLATTRSDTVTRKCESSDGDHGRMGLWQWQISSPESNQVFATNHYLCRRDDLYDQEPKCPFRGCADEDCEICDKNVFV